MDKLKEKIEEIVKKIQSDKDFADNFKKNPIGAVEKVIGIDLPDEQIQKVVDGVKAKLTAETAKGVFDSVKNIFNK